MRKKEQGVKRSLQNIILFSSIISVIMFLSVNFAMGSENIACDFLEDAHREEMSNYFDSIIVDYHFGGTIKLNPETFVITKTGLPVEYRKDLLEGEVTKDMIDSIINPIESLFITKNKPIEQGLKPDIYEIETDGYFWDITIYAKDGVIINEKYYENQYRNGKIVIYSTDFERLRKFIRGFFDKIYIENRHAYYRLWRKQLREKYRKNEEQ
ncbi:MAG: hypothetical protein K2M07_05135 [Muribaculaceae bacterium]|nr:hypothetical protein [Muribaculaceae bacterium]